MSKPSGRLFSTERLSTWCAAFSGALVLAMMAALTPATSGAASKDAPKVAPTKVAQSSVALSVNCNGADLMVSGDHDTLVVENCATINVIGDSNRITAHLLPQSVIAAIGSHNHIVFLHAPGFEAVVSSSGVGNEIVPDLSRDAAPTSPASLRKS